MAYIVSYAAEQDINDILIYIAQYNIQAAYTFVDNLYDAFEKLADNPYLGHVREDLTVSSVRFWTFKNHYLIVYEPTQPLQVIRVLSGFRDIAAMI